MWIFWIPTLELGLSRQTLIYKFADDININVFG